MSDKKPRGLAAASQEDRDRVSRLGGKAPHEKRGLQSSDKEVRQRVAQAGGLALGIIRRREAAERRGESA